MLLVIYNRPGFTGERIKNPDSYSLDIKITAPDGTIIYAGNGEETTSFEINIPEPALTPLPCRRGMPKGESTFGSKHRDPRLHKPLNSNKSEMAL